MEILKSAVILVIGFVLLIKGADYFVEGSSSVAKKFKVPSLIIGMTIVAMGTSLPELAVSVTAAMAGNNTLAVSNVAGSNIFNLMVVCGACALFAPLAIEKNTLMKEFPFSILCAGLLVVMGYLGMSLGRMDGVILLVIFAVYLFWMIQSAKKARTSGDKLEAEEEALAEGLAFADVIVLGPGLGTGEDAKKIIAYILENSDKSIVLDGDGITMCSREQLQKTKTPWILTPHPKEFCTISGWMMAELKEEFLQKVKQFAEEQGGIVVGKDARTCVSDGNECYVNISGNSGMATGGSGDVLAGTIGGLVAQGMSCFEAAKAAVYLHGLAGDRYKEKYGEHGMMARDLIDSLQKIHQNGE